MNGYMSFVSEAVCHLCGRAIAAPQVGDALLDEDGSAHVECICGAENLMPMAESYDNRTSVGMDAVRRALCAVVIWLLILGMVLLLIPVYHRAAYVEPPPTPIRLV
ncbi:MAG: hypothetical protein H0W86_01745 [Armatimonadetes bacterium]|nr:hypothetical protein [Armatimonadota bacterium]